MTDRAVTAESVVVASGAQVSTNVEDETVILDVDGGVYYGLDPVGARIWSLLQEPRTVAEIRDVLLDEYDVEPEPCEEAVQALVADLMRHGLVEVGGVSAR